MSSRRKYVISFAGFCLMFLLFGLFFVSYSDPFRNLDMPWQTKCPYHKNDVYKKFELMEKFEGAEALIVGASTSEAYGTEEIEKIFKTKTFNASIAGADTVTRLVLLEKGLETFKNLKYVFYISDFYEYNNPHTTTLTYYQEKLYPFIPEALRAQVRPTLKQRVYDIYSHQAFESASANLKDCLRGSRKEYYYPNGMTPHSMIIADADKLKETDTGYEEKLDQAFSKAITLHAAVMNGMVELSPTVKGLMKDIVSEVQKKNLKLFIIMSPYHPKFAPVLEKRKLVELRKEWVTFVHSLASDNVEVFDYEDNKLFPPSGNFWRDGHHYKETAAQLILKDVAKKTKLKN